MRLVVLAVGRLKAGPERVLVERYAGRTAPLAQKLGFGFDLHEIAESRARREPERRGEEAKALLGRIGEGPSIAFDERGAPLASDAFARRLGAWRDRGASSLHLVIGGPDGLDAAVRAQAALTLAFGAMTLPHQLVRVLVVEQVYRAMTILAGHPYHRS